MPSEETGPAAERSAEEAESIELGRQWFLVFVGVVLLDQAAIAAAPIYFRDWGAAGWGAMQFLCMAAGAYILYAGKAPLADMFATVLAIFGTTRLAMVALLVLQPLFSLGGKWSDLRPLEGGTALAAASGAWYFATAGMLAFHPAVKRYLASVLKANRVDQR